MKILKISVEEKLLTKGFNISENPKYNGYYRELASMVYNFLDKKTSALGVAIKKEIMQNE